MGPGHILTKRFFVGTGTRLFPQKTFSCKDYALVGRGPHFEVHMSGQISQIANSKVSRIKTFTKQHGAEMALGALAFLFVIAVSAYRSVLFTPDRARTWLVLLLLRRSS